MDKTIKELADELGVSKTAINKKVNANFKRKHFSKNGNKFLIDLEGQKLIREMFVFDYKEKRKLDNANQSQTNAFQVGDMVSVLTKRLEQTDEQLKEKDKQINELLSNQKQLQKLLDQQQVLTLQANKKIEELEYQVEEKNGKEEMVSEELEKEIEKNIMEKQPKGFFSRLFGKK